MKILYPIIAALLGLVSFTTVGCTAGVSQQQYDELADDLGEAQSQIQSLESRIAVMTDDLSECEEQIESLESDLVEAESELSDKTEQIEATNDKIERAKSKIEHFNSIFVPAAAGELDYMSESEIMNFFLDMVDVVNNTGDPLLEAKFQAIIDQDFSEDAMLDYFLYLLESIPEDLE